MSKDQMFAKMILASENYETGDKIYTFHCHYPRFIHSEVMTHRAFSRNARSSRAVPVSKMIKEVYENPVVPWHWHKNCPGMQGKEEHNNPIPGFDGRIKDQTKEEAWLYAAYTAAMIADGFCYQGYHKQIVNRLLEPFMWIDTLITSTQRGLDNFFELRRHKDAEPHIHDLADMVYECVSNADFRITEDMRWHLPYIQNSEFGVEEETLCKISAARCARISYNPFDEDNANIKKDLELFEKLAGSKPIHASALEHQARADKWVKRSGNLGRGWIQFRQLYESNPRNFR